MRDLRDHWADLRERMSAGVRLCVLTDFDGTLVDLESDPDLPRLDETGRRLLEGLLQSGRAQLGIVSGRSLADLVPRIELSGIWYVGNHGFEIRDPRGAERRFYEPEDVRYLDQVRDELARDSAGLTGLRLEHKGPILAVHYRNVDPARVTDVERMFIRMIERHRSMLMMSRGHAVFEARIRGSNHKGHAVRQIRRELAAGTLILYFGDDLTDRDAFRELKGVGLSIEVGGGEASIADYTLPDPSSVIDALKNIRAILESPGSLGATEPRPRTSRPPGPQ